MPTSDFTRYPNGVATGKKHATLTVYPNGNALLRDNAKPTEMFCGPASWVRSMATRYGYTITKVVEA